MTRDGETRAAIQEALLANVNADGGWGYQPRKASRLEPTCWALAGLHAAGALGPEAVSSARALFAAWRQPDGLLIDAATLGEGRPNLAFNGLAAWLLHQRRDLAADTLVAGLLSALQTAKGITVADSTINRQDGTLQGWPWIDGTFSWVEPTCWGLLALKAAGANDPIAAGRIGEAERLLIDRSCPAGGWNYGNGNMLGQDLNPYVSTTALGLIAMRERAEEPCVKRSLALLKAERLSEPSAMALGLTLVALRMWSETEEIDEVERALAAQWRRTQFLGNAHLMGLALYSLG